LCTFGSKYFGLTRPSSGAMDVIIYKVIKGTKWAIFTYTTPHIRKITNMFKNTDIKIAFKTSNTLRQLNPYRTNVENRVS